MIGYFFLRVTTWDELGLRYGTIRHAGFDAKRVLAVLRESGSVAESNPSMIVIVPSCSTRLPFDVFTRAL